MVRHPTEMGLGEIAHEIERNIMERVFKEITQHNPNIDLPKTFRSEMDIINRQQELYRELDEREKKYQQNGN